MRSAWLGITALLTGWTFGAVGPGDEPPLRLELHIDGKAHMLVEGEEAKLQVGERQITAKVTVAPTRRFDAAGVGFDFPRSFAFKHEADDASGLQTWTLDGNDVAVSVFAYPPGDGTDMAKTMLRNIGTVLGVDEPELRETSLKLGSRDHTCHACTVHVGVADLHLFAIDFIVDGSSRLLVLQDSGDDDGGPSQEFAQVRELLAKTFTTENH